MWDLFFKTQERPNIFKSDFLWNINRAVSSSEGFSNFTQVYYYLSWSVHDLNARGTMWHNYTHTHTHIDRVTGRRVHILEHTSTCIHTQRVYLMLHPTEMSKYTALTLGLPPLQEIWHGFVKCYTTCISQPVGLSQSLYLFME